MYRIGSQLRPIRWIALLALVLVWTPRLAPGQFGTIPLGGGKYPADISATVFPAVAFSTETVRLDVTVTLDAGYYIYAFDPDAVGPVGTTLSLNESIAITPAGEWKEPNPKSKFDKGFQANVNYHSGEVTFSREFNVADVAEGEYELKGSVRLQICDDSMCLPPRRNPFSATLVVRNPGFQETVAAAQATPVPTPTPMPAPEPSPEPEIEAASALQSGTMNATEENPQAHLDARPAAPTIIESEAEKIAASGFGGLVWQAFLLGLLSLLTPCVFPMIPITISFFTKRASKTAAQRIGLCSIYSGSIVIGFAIVGFVLALVMKLAGFGVERAGAVNQLAANPWFNLVLAGVFVLFGMSLLGLFEIGLPASWTNKLQKTKGGRTDAVGAMLMALIFVLVSFTCTAPIVGPLIVLTFEGHWLKPFVGLTSYAIGFALPFFVLGLIPSALQSLPQSGDWLHATKVTMGLLEVGLALKFLSNVDLVWQWSILTREVLLACWTAIGLIVTLYLLGLIRMHAETEENRIGPVRMGISILFGSVAFYLAFGLFGGQLNPFLESYLPPRLHQGGNAAVASSGSDVGGHGGVTIIKNDLEKAQEISKAENRPLFIDFTGWTCTNCRLNELNVFPDPAVQERMSQYVVVALYTDDKDYGEKYGKYQLDRFGTSALPFYALVSPEDKTLATFGGLIRDKKEFLRFLDVGLGNAPS